MSEIIKTEDYRQWLVSIKEKIQSSQIKAALAVNQELLNLYWFLGEQIIEKQKNSKWGDGFLKQMSQDLLKEFPEIKGFSRRNLFYMRKWVLFWKGTNAEVQQLAAHQSVIVQQVAAQLPEDRKQLVSQIPWGHNLVLLDKLDTPTDALFYVRKTIENNWSRAVLTHQIDSKLHLRQGKAIDNFAVTLPKPEGDLAKQILKDPYNFDFLTITERHNEQELENALIDHLTKFLLEFGAGFAFVGRQYKIAVDGDEYSIDLLFYHVRLHCYIVVDLKVVKFKPEFAGKLNFYISAIDSQVRSETDEPTLGILICKSKSDIKVEYALRDLNKPIGVSEYQITTHLPDQFRSSLPSIEQIEAELEGLEDE